MFALPLVGWGMLSAGGYPIPLIGSFHLPPILPHDKALYAILRPAHTVLAYLLFLTFLAHLGAALTHALVLQGRRLPQHGEVITAPWSALVFAGSAPLQWRVMFIGPRASCAPHD